MADLGTDGWVEHAVEVVLLLVSPEHRYARRSRDGAGPAPAAPEPVGRADVIAGRGLAGDRCSRRCPARARRRRPGREAPRARLERVNSYVLVYERSTGVLQHEKFGPGRHVEAFARRLLLDRQVGPGVGVIVLHGDSLEDLRTTHRRYFEDVHLLVARLSGSLAARTTIHPRMPRPAEQEDPREG